MGKNKLSCLNYFVNFPIGGILLALCIVVLAACTQQRSPCLTPKTATLNMETMHMATDSSLVPVDTALPGAIFVALTQNGSDSFQYLSQSSQFVLSLAPVTNVCQWAFTTDSMKYHNLFDTLTFYYQRNLQFLSNACGYTYFYTIDSVSTTHNNIDSLLLTNTAVTNNVATKHLRLYIHTQY